MEAINQFIVDLAAKAPIVGYILMGLGALMVIAQAVVILTPSKEDDAFVEKLKAIPVLGQLLILLEAFSPLQKKPDGGLTLSASKKD
jgi:hypothetical protein